MAEQDAGDPGRTPGSAEGDLETIEEDLREKLGSDGDKVDSENKPGKQSDESEDK